MFERSAHHRRSVESRGTGVRTRSEANVNDDAAPQRAAPKNPEWEIAGGIGRRICSCERGRVGYRQRPTLDAFLKKSRAIGLQSIGPSFKGVRSNHGNRRGDSGPIRVNPLARQTSPERHRPTFDPTCRRSRPPGPQNRSNRRRHRRRSHPRTPFAPSAAMPS